MGKTVARERHDYARTGDHETAETISRPGYFGYIHVATDHGRIPMNPLGVKPD